MIIAEVIRWKEWYHSKLALFVFANYYLLFLSAEITFRDLFPVILLICWFILLMAFGYMINDYADQFSDRAAGKEKLLSKLKKNHQILILLLIFCSTFLFLLPFHKDPIVIALSICNLALAIMYSAPPFRLKERGIWGIIGASMAQWMVPVVMVFAVFGHYDVDTFIFAVFYLLIGLRFMFTHQLHDYPNDIQSGTLTFAVEYTPEKTYRLARFLFSAELLFLLALIALIAVLNPFFIALMIVYLLFFMTCLYPVLRKKGLPQLLSSFDTIPLADLYFFWLPFCLSLFLGLKNPVFFIVTLVELVWKMGYLRYYKDMIWLKRTSGV
ncbi:MAG TPA: UbiA family prenyltransferase [Methanoregulaceae archaeon]|nr:UbiA family prenyltransferase [Methanoregulaceae archaeon]